MPIFDIVRRAMLAGFGVQERVKEFIDELVKKGELSESQGAKLVKEWTERAEKSTAELNKTLTELVEKTLQRMNLPTKAEMEKLNKKLQNLSQRLRRLEEAKGQAEEPEE
jgi:poly(hydroxyalkanoate) granule-associated protein